MPIASNIWCMTSTNSKTSVVVRPQVNEKPKIHFTFFTRENFITKQKKESARRNVWQSVQFGQLLALDKTSNCTKFIFQLCATLPSLPTPAVMFTYLVISNITCFWSFWRRATSVIVLLLKGSSELFIFLNLVLFPDKSVQANKVFNGWNLIRIRWWHCFHNFFTIFSQSYAYVSFLALTCSGECIKKQKIQKKGKTALLPRPFIVGNQWRSPQFTNLLIGKSRNMMSEGQVNFRTKKKTEGDQTNNEKNYSVGKLPLVYPVLMKLRTGFKEDL